LPPESIAVTWKVCVPLVEVSTVPVHDRPLAVCVQEACVPVDCVHVAAVRYGPVGLLKGWEVLGLLQEYAAFTGEPFL